MKKKPFARKLPEVSPTLYNLFSIIVRISLNLNKTFRIYLKADQICYSVLCVFSYVAAGQEQKKAPSQKVQHGHHQQHHHQQHHQQQSRSAQKPTQPLKQTQQPPTQLKRQTVTINQTIQPQKPAVTVANVQPQTIQMQSTPPTTMLQNQPSAPVKRLSITPETPNANLPEVPPRIQSQNSVTARGPPPAIPPRKNVPVPTRASSIQVQSVTAQQRPALARQASANSIQPQCTPQPPPKFVIPALTQRQNSRTSMGRTGSISGPSSSSSTANSSAGGSPQMQRKH